MKKAIVFLANGFEEMEATGTVDVLCRGGVEVKTVSISSEREVTGAHGMVYLADATFGDMDFSEADALILPGGMPGSSNLNDCEPLKELLVDHYKKGKIVAAICAAPMVLGGLGLLKGRRATCYPGFEPKLIGATATGEAVEVDGNVITGKGPGLVFKTLPNIFQQMAGGIVWALLFYILLFLASITSIISLLEVVIAYINETWHLSRIKSSRIVSAITIALGVLSALSFNLLSFVKIGGMGLFDFSDFITAKVLMPLGGIAMAIFIGWRMGREEVKNEITNMGKYPVAIYKIYMVLIRFVVPIGITAIFISSLLPH